MLRLSDICKDYTAGDSVVHALKNVNLQFRDSEFVSILGASGCGKTTMLNIIGGLDRYTSGDLRIDGVSTKEFKDVDWDAYRNLRVGFIFQSYNLISHIDILSNVEMALTLSGVSAQERKRRATQALSEVGLGEQIHKRPNQLSGGQMQRVSIARALINNPEIILADEPTGALDSVTSVQIMEILKKISQDKLVIMVTHNPDLAKEYSTRIIRLTDGEVVSDSMPFEAPEETRETTQAVEALPDLDAMTPPQRRAALKDKKKKERALLREKKKKLGKTSMSYFTALKLSFNNLMTKKGRTIMTSIAGSIGIIGVALVLAISNGFQGYIQTMQHDILAGYPIEIARSTIDTNKAMSLFMGGGTGDTSKPSYPDKDVVYPYNPMTQWQDLMITNDITRDYVDYLATFRNEGLADSIYYSYGIDVNLIGRINNKYNGFLGNGSFKDLPEYCKVNQSSSVMGQMMGSVIGGGSNSDSGTPDVGWQQLTGGKDYILSQYEVLAGSYPTNKNEVVLVVDKRNQLNQSTLASLGLPYGATKLNFEEIIGSETKEGVTFRAVTNNAMYQYDEQSGLYAERDAEELYLAPEGTEGIYRIKVVGILRQREEAQLTTLSTGIAYTEELTMDLLADSMNSDIVKAQRAMPGTNVLTGKSLSEETYRTQIEQLGGSDLPTSINVYPKDFDSKEKILKALDQWNADHKGSEVVYNDMSAMATDMMSETLRIISIVLVCFASVSLLVSSVMIGIITYVSVVERTKEIGILRSLGARKRDISNVFNAETAIIGFAAGVFGVLITYLLSIPINLIINWKIGISTLCSLSPLHALLMIVISMGLTIIAGLIPSRVASKRDPVVALRTE